MPPAPDHPPDPTTLHQAFQHHGPLDWGVTLPTLDDMVRLHGRKAVEKSLRLLERAVTVEPQITAQFVASLPPAASPYHLTRRVKSPESLARKMRDRQRSGVRRPVDDLLRYTLLTETPENLVPAAQHATDELTRRGWQVTYAMHSYVEGSRYKGIHAYLRTPDFPRVEVQFHSVASVEVKELTAPWYEIERSARATDEERTAARQRCVEASDPLDPPPGIRGLTTLGGRHVAVNNFNDSRQWLTDQGRTHQTTSQGTGKTATLRTKGGIAR